MTAAPSVDWSDVMFVLAKHLAAELGPEWSAQPDKYDRTGYADIARADGAACVLQRVQVGTGVLRIEVSGRYAYSADGTRRFGPSMTHHYQGSRVVRVTHPPRITCDATRPHAVTARAIRRRFLPAYMEAYAKSVAERDAYDAGIVVAQLAAARVGQAGDVTPRKSGRNEAWAIWFHGGTIYVREAHADGPHVSARLDGISVEQAVRIARILRGDGSSKKRAR